MRITFSILKFDAYFFYFIEVVKNIFFRTINKLEYEDILYYEVFKIVNVIKEINFHIKIIIYIIYSINSMIMKYCSLKKIVIQMIIQLS